MKFKTIFIKDYKSLQYSIQQRAGALLFIIFSAFILLAIENIAIISLKGGDFYLHKHLLTTFVFGSVLFADLIFLKYSKFIFAGNFSATSFLIIDLLLIFYRISQGNDILLNFSGGLYIAYATLILSALFATRLVFIVNAMFFLVGVWVLYFMAAGFAAQDVTETLKMIFIFINISVVMGGLLLFFIVHFAVKSQKKTQEHSDLIEEQDRKNQNLIKTVKNIIEQQQGFTDELSKAVNTLSSGSNEQAADIEEISAALEEIDSAAEQNANNANITNKAIQKTAQNAEDSKDIINLSAESIKNISGFIQIIEDIAFQTNLLSLNASIEAEKADEAGKGFSVIAGEIRVLANKSAEASKKVYKLIKNSFDTTEVLQRKLNTVIKDIQSSALIVNKISISALEQKNSTTQLNYSVLQANKTAQINANLSEKISELQKKLNADTEKLKNFIDEHTVFQLSTN